MDTPFPHVATLNLFREPDEHHEITVSDANLALVQSRYEDDLKPIDVIENLIIQAAEAMKARKCADGTYRDYRLPGGEK